MSPTFALRGPSHRPERTRSPAPPGLASQGALVLWGREKLAEDSGLHDEHAGSFGGIVLAHNVRSRAEVDAILDAAEEAGATVTRAAAETFYGGYAGVFLDLDGHAWEIAHNPALAIGQDGALAIPDFTR